jgi:hypothetical protein
MTNLQTTTADLDTRVERIPPIVDDETVHKLARGNAIALLGLDLAP